MVASLFSESASRAVVTVAKDQLETLLDRAKSAGVPAREIGTTGGMRLRISVGGRPVIEIGVREAETVWETALEKYFVRRVA
jgi:phosphoribosylformylglycinamidine synthase